MARLLKEFWEDARSKAFVWGECDCALWVASYVEAKTGTHPAPELVGRYDSAFGARRLIMRHGGLVSLVRSYAGGFKAGKEVGVYDVNGTVICGVGSPKGVAFKTEQGLMVTRGAVLIEGWDI